MNLTPSPRITVLVVIMLAASAGLFLGSTGCAPPKEMSVGALPIPDALPLSLGLYKPIFEENRLAVSLTFYETSEELSAALANGQVHAALIDLPSAMLLNQDSETVKIVRIALRGSPTMAKFAVVTAADSAIQNPDGLKTADIAVPLDLSSQYAADALLTQAGISPGDAHEVEVASPAQGLQRLQEGAVAAALLPQPFIAMAVGMGARVVLADTDGSIGQSVIVYTQEEMVRYVSASRFLVAYEQATSELNTRGDQYRGLMAEVANLPPGVDTSFPMPLFPFPADVPTESEIESANAWLVSNNILAKPLAYSNVTDARFLPNALEFSPALCCQ